MKKYPLYEIEPVTDLRALLSEAAEKDGGAIAWQQIADLGEQPVDYAGLFDRIRALETALDGLGTAAAHIAAVGDGGFSGFSLMMTVLCGGGVWLPVSEELPTDEILHILRAGDAEAVFLSEAVLPALREKAARLPGIRYFICEGLPRDAQDDRFLSYERLVETGRQLLADGKAAAPAAVDPEEPALLCYTAGSAESGKGVVLTRANLLFALNGTLSLLAPCGGRLSLLSPGTPAELLCNILPALCEHTAIYRLEKAEELLPALRSCMPESALLTPLQLESLYRGILASFEEQGKGELLRQTLRKSDQLRRAGIDRRSDLFESIREVFGGNLRRILCVGVPPRPEVSRFFDSVGIPVLPVYGLPECCGVAAMQRDLRHDPESSGVPLPGTEVRISEPDAQGSGEILLRSDGIMKGYYNDRKATREIIDGDGWLHTGDIGCLDGKGRLFVTGNKQTRILLKSGQTVYPEEIEGYLLEIPYVEEARVSAYAGDEGETKLCATLFLREETVSELSDDDRLKLLKREADDLNESLPSYKQLRRVRIRKTPFPKEG